MSSNNGDEISTGRLPGKFFCTTRGRTIEPLSALPRRGEQPVAWDRYERRKGFPSLTANGHFSANLTSDGSIYSTFRIRLSASACACRTIAKLLTNAQHQAMAQS